MKPFNLNWIQKSRHKKSLLCENRNRASLLIRQKIGWHRVEVEVICQIVEKCQMYTVVATHLAPCPPCHVMEIAGVTRPWENSMDILKKVSSQ